MENQVDSSLYFAPGALSGAHLLGVIRDVCWFKPTRMSSDVTGSARYGKATLEELGRSPGVRRLYLASKEGASGPALDWGSNRPAGFQSLGLYGGTRETPPVEALERISELPGFACGHSADGDDSLWQNRPWISRYESAGRPYEHLPTILDDDGTLIVDVSKNPGCRVNVPGMVFQSSWRMWFGAPSFKYIPRERLLSFGGAQVVREQPSGVVFVQLYEDPHEVDLPRNRAVQQAFKEWVGLDRLAAEEFDWPAPDPTVEYFTEGQFESHGGTGLAIYWLGDDGKPLNRSRATTRCSREYGADGKVVWESVERVT